MSSDHLQDLINLSSDMEKFIKAILKSDNAAPDRENTFEDELKSVQEQLKREEQKRAELETKNKKLQELVVNKKLEGVDMQELQEEIQQMDKDMDKIDMLRAGYVSRDSQTTEESFCLHQTGEQQQSNDSLISLKYEREIEQLQRKVSVLETEKRLTSKRENKFLAEKEKLLSELDSSNAKVEEMKAELNVKADESQLAAAASKTEIEQKLADTTVYCKTIEEELKKIRGIKEDLEIKLNEKHCQLEQLSKKENVENELKAQVYSLCQEIETKDEENDDLNARLELSVTECNKINSARNEMRKELDTVYSQNEKLLTERKGQEAENVELRSKIDNLTAQLLSAEEMLDHKENDLRKALEQQKSLASELETVPLLKEQFDVFQADFNTERQTRQKVEEDNRKLRDEVDKLRADNERLTEEANDPTGSRLAEMQRRHGCGSVSQPGGNDNSPWSGFYDQFLAPRGPAVARNGSHHPHGENDINRQVSGGRCPKCDLMFPDLDTLQTHVVGCLESESTGSVEGKICPKCQGSFPDLDTLQIHVMECLDN